ncbi:MULTISPECIES: CoA transferase [Roseobacteraceae]|uniref:CaiB/BaiF CoA transferase family protein n=1 Tax=Roseobacteraceae TaxID=2854170 RepID=UPI003296C809
MNGPLHGVRVIDLTTVISGPLATMTLGDQGADIIKIEDPRGGDFSRHVATRRAGMSASFLNNNRNKRSVALDLKTADGLQAVQTMAAQSDVFIQNFRPGVAERLGLGYEALSALNPTLIYVSIAGFGHTGPLAQNPVYDPLIQAISALTSVQAGSDEDRPRLVRTILPDKLTGIQTSQAITAALFARERTGQGQHIQISMLDVIIAFLWSSDMNGHTFVGAEMEREEAQSYIDLIYEVKDGFVSVAVMQDKQWQGFTRAVQRPDLLEDPRFATPELREVNRDARLAAIQDAVKDFAAADLIKLLDAENVPNAPVLSRTQMRQHPQVVANGVVVETLHPIAGLLRQARHPSQFSKTPASIRRPAPALGEHTDEVLADFGIAATPGSDSR